MREELYIGIWHILVFVYLLNLLMADGKEESINIVQFLKTNSGKKGEGMPVVRNPQFYFREGLCWSDINTMFLKCRKKEKSIHDVKSMSILEFLICFQKTTSSQ